MSIDVEAAGVTIWVEGEDDDRPGERATLRLSAEDAEKLCVQLEALGFGAGEKRGALPKPDPALKDGYEW